MDTTPIPASYASSSSFTVASGYVPQFVAGVRVLADCGADGGQYGTVASVSGTTVTLTMDSGNALTANLVAVQHGNDIPASLANHGHTGPADGGLIGTATPTANAHPIASALGKLTAWIDAATTAVAGIVKLATTAMCQAGTDMTTAVTPAGLAASAKGLISTNTTIYVATTGSDSTGDGSSGAPFASIGQALYSIRNKLIASGVTVTIQVADGTYAVTSTITINHPDADKIQIIGNTSAETVVAIAAIDTTARTIAVAGDRTSSLSAGDTAGVTGSAGNNGTYTVLSATYSGGATVIAVSEAIPSATADGTLTIKPCNRCVLQLSNGARGFSFTTGVNAVDGFAIVGDGSTSSIGLLATGGPAVLVGAHTIVRHAYFGAYGTMGGGFNLLGGLLHNNTYGLYADTGGKAILSGTLVIDGATVGLVASNISIIRTLGNAVYGARTADPATPDYDTAGNANSYISSS